MYFQRFISRNIFFEIGIQKYICGNRFPEIDFGTYMSGNIFPEIYFRKGPSSKDIDFGPCPARNERPRRAADVMLSQIKAAIEIFKSRPITEFMLQMIVYDETMNFLELLYE